MDPRKELGRGMWLPLAILLVVGGAGSVGGVDIEVRGERRNEWMRNGLR